MTSCATLARLKVFISCHIMALVRYSVIREIWVNAASVFPMPAAKDLGVTIDSELQLDKLVNNKVRLNEQSPSILSPVLFTYPN